MSSRLQVVMDEQELARVREDAKRHGLTVSEWVRQSLVQARRRPSGSSVEARLQAIDRALGVDGPTGEIDEMLAEIEAGRAR